ncbi:MAG: signal peptidase I [Clostridia bacterium]
MKKTKKNKNISLIAAIIIGLAVSLLFRGYIFESIRIEGDSMDDTLHNGDRVVLNKILLYENEIERGDLVIIEVEKHRFTLLKFFNDIPLAGRLFRTPVGKDYIKRVVAVGGDVVDMKDGWLYINGERQEEPYTKDVKYTFDKGFIKMPYLVEEGKYYVLGDNRADSNDSRNFGAIGKDMILGIVRTRIWPPGDMGRIDK